MARAAAFFDLDRTLLKRSSALALAGSFREHGVIGRGQLAKAAAWQLLFAARGASAETVRKAAEDGLMVLKGFRVDDLRNLVATAMEPVLKPLVYQEPLELVARHRERGEPVYIVSATLQEIVEELARELGFDGAIGSTCEIVDGVYTGRSLRGAHGEGKAAAIRELAEQEGLDLAASTAYSDSHTDLPFLEAVGNAVVVNPDRELRLIADDRGWPMLEFGELAYPPGADSGRRCSGIPLVLGAGAAVWAAAGVLPEERIAALGFSEADTATLAAHFLDAESRGKLGHGLARIDWLETLPDLQPDARPMRMFAEPGYERWDGAGALGYLTLAAICDAQLAEPPRTRASSSRRTASRPACSAGTCGGWPRRLVAALTATSPARLAHPDGGEPLAGTNPLAIAIPSSDGKPLVTDVSMGAVTHGDVLRGAAQPEELVPFGGEQAHKAFALALGLRAARRRARR